MGSFWQLYWKLVGLAVIMFICAAVLYLVTFRDAVLDNEQVGRIIKELDAIEKKGEPEDRRRIILDEMIHGRAVDFMHSMLEHVAEALILAGVMIAAVEGFTRYHASKEAEKGAAETARNVWSAIFERLVPEEIATEIQRILKSDICRINPRYVVTLTKGSYTDLRADRIIVKRALYYKLHNITGGETKWPITINVVNHAGEHEVSEPGGARVTLPRICTVRIKEDELSLAHHERTSFSKTKTLPKMKSEDDAWDVYSEVEEVYDINDRALYVLSAPCYDLELQVVNEIPNLVRVQAEKVYLTVGQDRLRLIAPLHWRAEGGLLSGTALSLSWEPTAKGATMRAS